MIVTANLPLLASMQLLRHVRGSAYDNPADPFGRRLGLVGNCSFDSLPIDAGDRASCLFVRVSVRQVLFAQKSLALDSLNRFAFGDGSDESALGQMPTLDTTFRLFSSCGSETECHLLNSGIVDSRAARQIDCRCAYFVTRVFLLISKLFIRSATLVWIRRHVQASVIQQRIRVSVTLAVRGARH